VTTSTFAQVVFLLLSTSVIEVD